MARFCILVICALSSVLPSLVKAGSSEAGKPVLPKSEVAAFSNRVQQDLAARGARVAIVARVGRSPATLPPGVRYTHVSFWIYSQITRSDGSTGRGYQAYNLYQKADNRSQSHLVQDSPADFFAGAHQLDAGVIVPDIRLQKKLMKVISGPTYSRLHNARYSVLSNPNTRQFQNCTEHTLDVVMASLYGTKDPSQIKANIAAYFKPQDIQLSGLKRLLAPAASQALTTEDHGSKVATATFGSIAQFMKSNKLEAAIYRITPTQIMRFQ